MWKLSRFHTDHAIIGDARIHASHSSIAYGVEDPHVHSCPSEATRVRCACFCQEQLQAVPYPYPLPRIDRERFDPIESAQRLISAVGPVKSPNAASEEHAGIVFRSVLAASSGLCGCRLDRSNTTSSNRAGCKVIYEHVGSSPASRPDIWG